MDELQVQLLGGLRLAYQGAPLTTFKTPRLQALLVYLVLNPGRPQFRYHLAYTFWPDSREAQARTNLRNLIYLFRQALPDCDRFLALDAQTLYWRAEAPYTLDVAEFERCLAPAPGVLPGRADLERAVHLYRGDLLPGCYDDWIGPERDRLRRAYLSALESLANMAENTRDYAGALDYAGRLLQAEPLHARANRQLIRLHALVNNRPAALKAYRAYARLLDRELGVRPDRETQELAEYLQQHPEQDRRPPSPEARTSLVGRQAEWRRLQAAWRSAAAGNPQAVFVTGEAGIGKTRLAEELVQWASRQGIRTAVARCYPAEGSLPYAPAVDWLRRHALPRLEEVWLVELSRLMPELLKAYPKLSPPAALNKAWQRQRLFEALARAILGNRGRLLLVIEDIHWCDQDTLEWLHFLLRFDAQAPLLVVATQRVEEIPAAGYPLKNLQTALKGVGKFTEIELKPLSQAESYQLASLVAEKSAHPPLNPDLSEAIFRQTEGNPLFVVEMVQLGQIMPPQESPPAEQGGPMGRAQAVLERRIHQVAPATREIASLAATIGREFPLGVLRQACAEREENLVEAVDELLHRRIIREISPDTYDFTHDRLRQAVFSGLSTAHRRLLHRKVAEAYLRLDESSLRPRDAEIASHYERAGLPRQAVAHYRLAAEAAARLFANAEAQRYLQRAIDLAEALGVGGPNGLPPADFAGLLERSGDMLLLNGRFPKAQATFERALAQPFAAPGAWRSQVYRKISDALIPQYQHPQAHAALDQAEGALPLPEGGGSPAERQEWIQIQLARSQLFYWDNHPDQIDLILRKIAPIIEAEGELDQRNALLTHQIYARLRHERYRLSPETVEIARRRLALAEQLGDPYHLALGRFQLGFCLLWSGDPAAARGWLAQGYEDFARLGARLWQMRCLAYVGIVSRKLGDLEALPGQTQEMQDLARAMNEYTYQGIAYANQGWLAWQNGDPAQAEQLCHMAKEIWKKFGQNVFHGLADWILLAIAVSQQDLRRVEGCLQSLLDPDRSLQPVEEPMAGLLSRARSACLEQDSGAVFALCSQAVEHARTHREL